MKKAEYLNLLRQYLHDVDGKVWSDAELVEFLEDAAHEYSSDTGLYRGDFSFRVDANGTAVLPQDYLRFVAGWNDARTPVEAISTDELKFYYGNYPAVKGRAQFVYEDLTDIGRNLLNRNSSEQIYGVAGYGLMTLPGYGTLLRTEGYGIPVKMQVKSVDDELVVTGGFRLCPNPAELQSITAYGVAQCGLMILPGYGTLTSAEGFGIPLKLYEFNPAGDAVYCRTEVYENIEDYMALADYVLYLAYAADSDFQSTDKSELYLTEYQNRIARTRKIRSCPGSIKSSPKYF